MTLYDKDIEKYVLMLMVYKPELIPNICNECGESDFYFEINRDIFRIINRLKQNQKRVDIGEIFNEYKKEGIYIASLSEENEMFRPENWKYYAETVRHFSMARGLVELTKSVHDIDDKNIDKKLADIISGANKIAENNGGSEILSAREILGDAITRIEGNFQRGGKMSGYDWGLEELNRITDGIQNEYIIIGARASVGKTGLALNVARELSKNKIPTGYFSLEMSGTSLMLRIISDISSTESGKIRSGFLGKDQLNRIVNAGDMIKDFPLYVVDKSRGALEKIMSQCRYMVRVMGIKVIFIDHASLIKHPDKRLKRYEQFSEISNDLQNLQRELNVPIILLAQLGRDTEGQMPSLADLRESGSFEQDADQVILLHRERVTDAEKTNIPTVAYVAKNRNGACGFAKLSFLPQYARFIDDVEKTKGNR